jgi:hypothetical protein
VVYPSTYPQPYHRIQLFVGYTSVILLHNRGEITILKSRVAFWNIRLDNGDTAVGTKPKYFACLRMNMALYSLNKKP